MTETENTKRNCLSTATVLALSAWLKRQGDLTRRPVTQVAQEAASALQAKITAANVRNVAEACGVPLYHRFGSQPEPAPIQLIKESLAVLAQAIIDHVNADCPPGVAVCVDHRIRAMAAGGFSVKNPGLFPEEPGL